MTKNITFSELNPTQRINLGEAMLKHHHVSCENTLVEYVLQKSGEDTDAPFCLDDKTNNTPTGEVEINGSWHTLESDERETKLELYEHLLERAQSVYDSLEALQGEAGSLDHRMLVQAKLDKWEKVLERIQSNYDNLEALECEDYPEIMQWFACSGWLLRELYDEGECTLSDTYWGRCCYGQAIALDCVIQRIAFKWFSDFGSEYITEGSEGWRAIFGA